MYYDRYRIKLIQSQPFIKRRNIKLIRISFSIADKSINRDNFQLSRFIDLSTVKIYIDNTFVKFQALCYRHDII